MTTGDTAAVPAIDRASAGRGSLVPGELLAGKYRVEGRIAEGGMAVVYRAIHLDLETVVAIKVIRPDFELSEALVARLLAEAKVVASLRSKHINRVLDVGRTDAGGPFLVLEHLIGSDLAHHLGLHGRLPYVHAVDCVMQACEGLAEAHGLGIVHRDLKPENLFLSEELDGSLIVKVLDFGISKRPSTAPVRERSVTMTGTLMGTPDYMAPEQVRGEEAVDARSDVWALGVVLHELCTGKVPFPGESMAQVFAQILEADWLPSKVASDSLPPGLLAVVARCLRKEPRERYQNVVELASALSQFGSDAARAEGVARVSRTTVARATARHQLLSDAREDAATPIALVSTTPSSQLERLRKARHLKVGALLGAGLCAAVALTLLSSQLMTTRSAAPPVAATPVSQSTVMAVPTPAPTPAPTAELPVASAQDALPPVVATGNVAPAKRGKASSTASNSPARASATALSQPPASASAAVALPHSDKVQAATPTLDAWNRKNFGGRR